jgi:hypothetical protein
MTIETSRETVYRLFCDGCGRRYEHDRIPVFVIRRALMDCAELAGWIQARSKPQGWYCPACQEFPHAR